MIEALSEGEVVHVFANRREVEEIGFDWAAVRGVLAGRRKKYKKMQWRRQSTLDLFGVFWGRYLARGMGCQVTPTRIGQRFSEWLRLTGEKVEDLTEADIISLIRQSKVQAEVERVNSFRVILGWQFAEQVSHIPATV